MTVAPGTRPSRSQRRPASSPAFQPDLLLKPSGRTAILTASGFVLDLANPDATGLPVEDIARALAYQPRWCGATRAFYSVAEHSVLVSRLAPAPHRYSGLWHDAIEAVTGDWPSPLKIHFGRDEINRKLIPLEAAFQRRFGYQSHAPGVKTADLEAMATELRDLLPAAWMDWGHLPPPHPDSIVPVGPERAYALFMERYEELKHLAAPPPKRHDRPAAQPPFTG